MYNGSNVPNALINEESEDEWRAVSNAGFPYIEISKPIELSLTAAKKHGIITAIPAKKALMLFAFIFVPTTKFTLYAINAAIVLDSIIKMYTHISLTPIPYDSSKMLSSVSIYRFANISKEYSL